MRPFSEWVKRTSGRRVEDTRIEQEPVFARLDVFGLRRAAALLRGAKDDRGMPVAWPEDTFRLDDIAARIEATLPEPAGLEKP